MTKISGLPLRAALVDPFLAQLRPLGASLADLELGIRFADDVDGSLPLHDLTISVTIFGGTNRRDYFHRKDPGLGDGKVST